MIDAGKQGKRVTVDGDTPWIRAKSHPWDYDRSEVDELSAQENCRVFAYEAGQNEGKVV